MRNNFTLKGTWYLPDNPQKTVIGTLTYEFDKGAELEFHGSLNDNFTRPIEVDIILGTTTTGKVITLYKCYEYQVTIGESRPSTSIWKIIFVVDGGHFNNSKELRFHSVATSFHNLNEWLGVSGFKTSLNKINKHKFGVNYTLPKKIEFQIDEIAQGAFNFTFKVPRLIHAYDISIIQNSEYIIESKGSELSLEQLLRYVSNFQNFLTLGTYESTFPLEIKLKRKKLEKVIAGENYPEKYTLFYSVPLFAPISRPKILWEFLFNYRDIKKNFKVIIKKWHINCNDIEPVINLLMDSFYQSGHFNENKFLNMAQALETFHRRKRKNNVISEKQHKKRITEIKKSVPKKYFNFIDSRLVHSNEPSLHMRLDYLFQEFNTKTFSKIVPNKDLFIKQTKDSRNYYTHYDGKMEKKALKGGDLFYLTEKMKVILISGVLRESGISFDLIEKLLARNEYKFFNHLFEP